MRRLTKRDSRACAQEGREKSPARACPYGQTFRQFLKLSQHVELVVLTGKGLKTGCSIFGVRVAVSKIRKIAEAEDASHYPRATTFDIVRWDG